MKRLAFGGVAAMSLLLSACALEASLPAEEPETGSVEAAYIPPCDEHTPHSIYWYSDFAKTKEVGRDDCDCGYWATHGTHGPHYKVVFYETCPIVEW